MKKGLMKINTAIPILRVPKFVQEGDALGKPVKTTEEYVSIIMYKLSTGQLREPLYVDRSGRGLMLVEMLRSKGAEVIEFVTQVL